MLNLNKQAVDFFVSGYFGFDEGSLEEKCARRAYLDLCRTLNFAEKTTNKTSTEKKKIEKTRKVFCDSIIGIIVTNIENYKNDFDKWHEKTCTEIIKKAKELKILKEEFTYGHAQKWLNMTLKYMWLLGILSNKFDINDLHIPLDNFIFQAIKEDIRMDEKTNTLKNQISVLNKNEQYQYKRTAWSKLSKDDYQEIQNALPHTIIDKSRIEWESKAWIEVAKNRSNK